MGVGHPIVVPSKVLPRALSLDTDLTVLDVGILIVFTYFVCSFGRRCGTNHSSVPGSVGACYIIVALAKLKDQAYSGV